MIKMQFTKNIQLYEQLIPNERHYIIFLHIFQLSFQFFINGLKPILLLSFNYLLENIEKLEGKLF